MTLVDHMEEIEQKWETIKREKEEGKEDGKKGNEGIKKGQEYGWILGVTENKKNCCISQLPPSKNVASLIPALGLSLSLQLSIQDSYKLRHFTQNSFKQKHDKPNLLEGKSLRMWLFKSWKAHCVIANASEPSNQWIVYLAVFTVSCSL